MSNNKQLTGLLLFYYLMERFDMSISDAYEDMKEHNQDLKEVELMFLDIHDYMSRDGAKLTHELRQKHVKEFA